MNRKCLFRAASFAALLATLFGASLVSSAAWASDPREPSAASAAALLGVWRVDLRPSPQSPPSVQPFSVTEVSADAGGDGGRGTFQGTFYGTPIQQGRWNAEWGAVRVSFISADGSGPYFHTAVLQGSRLEGMTHSTGRNFLMVWSATKP